MTEGTAVTDATNLNNAWSLAVSGAYIFVSTDIADRLTVAGIT